jgi:hypothetical protein
MDDSSAVAEQQKCCNGVSVDENEVPVDEKPNEITDTGEEELTLVGVNKRVDDILGSIQTIIQDGVEAAVQEGYKTFFTNDTMSLLKLKNSTLSPAALVALERALDDDDYGDDYTTVPSKGSRSEQLESRLQPLYVTER